jgi:Transposase, Mutator family
MGYVQRLLSPVLTARGLLIRAWPDGCGAEGRLRREERGAPGKGYHDRNCQTWAGGRGAYPKMRKGPYFPGVVEPRRMAEKALTVVHEAYAQGSPIGPCSSSRGPEIRSAVGWCSR